MDTLGLFPGTLAQLRILWAAVVGDGCPGCGLSLGSYFAACAGHLASACDAGRPPTRVGPAMLPPVACCTLGVGAWAVAALVGCVLVAVGCVRRHRPTPPPAP